MSSNAYEKLLAFGLSEEDARVIADCVIKGKSCSWINTDEFDLQKLVALNNFLKENSSLYVSVQPVPTRGKLIWDVKIRK